jgi:hypothetical protein
MQEVAMDYKKIFLGAGAAHRKLGANVEANYERYKYWFRYTPTKDVDLARTLFAVMGSIGQQIRSELKTDAPKVALLAEKAVWTEGLIAAAQKNLPGMKMEVVGLWQPSATATDVTAELSAIDRAGAQIVFTMLSGPVGIVVGRQMGERNMKAVACGTAVAAGLPKNSMSKLEDPVELSVQLMVVVLAAAFFTTELITGKFCRSLAPKSTSSGSFATWPGTSPRLMALTPLPKMRLPDSAWPLPSGRLKPLPPLNAIVLPVIVTLEPDVERMPSPAFGREEPVMPRPILLPWMVMPSTVCSWIPAAPFPEITLFMMVELAAPGKLMPYAVPPPAGVPSAVPMKLLTMFTCPPYEVVTMEARWLPKNALRSARVGPPTREGPSAPPPKNPSGSIESAPTPLQLFEKRLPVTVTGPVSAQG